MFRHRKSVSTKPLQFKPVPTRRRTLTRLAKRWWRWYAKTRMQRKGERNDIIMPPHSTTTSSRETLTGCRRKSVNSLDSGGLSDELNAVVFSFWRMILLCEIYDPHHDSSTKRPETRLRVILNREEPPVRIVISPESRRFPNPRAHVNPRCLCSARLRPCSSFGSGLLTLFTRRAAVRTQFTRNRQLLTRARSKPGSRICDHCTFTTTPANEET